MVRVTMPQMTRPRQARDRLIVALDFSSLDEAFSLVQKLQGRVLINVHASGGRKMMQAAAEATSGHADVIAVTVLTSLRDEDVREAGFALGPDELVPRLARLALEAGLDGVVAAPTDAARLRRELGSDFLIVTPGIRPAGSTKDDQARIATPAEAVRQGADYIVVGRPITQAVDPVKAAEAIVAEMGEGLWQPS